MKYSTIKIYFLIALGALSFTGCKKFLDVNTNPNIATELDVDLVLPSSQVAIAHVLGNQFQVNGSFWAQYWTQSPLANQYKQYDQYQPSTDNYNRSWRILYSDALTDLQYVYSKAKSKNSKQYMAVSRLLTAYTYQMIVDAWGEAPYTEALKALEADGAIVNPKYDMESIIYEGIVSQIDEAISLIDIETDAHPGNDDLIYHGDMYNWMLFASTLKLKVALRMSEVNPARAQAIIATIESDPKFLGYISSDVDEAKVMFTSAGGSQNPLYSEMVGLSKTQNLFASSTCVDSMNSNFDPRAFVFYKPTSAGTIVGITQGDYSNSTNATGKSIPSAKVAGEAANENSSTAPVRLLSSYESLFLQSEAVARGWIPGSDQDLFEAGIMESFKAYLTNDDVAEVIRDSFANMPISPSSTFTVDVDYAAYRYIHGDTVTGYLNNDTVANTNLPLNNWGVYPATGTMQEKVRHIITQKWFSMCGNQGFEAWTEWRRTGYPDFLVISVNSLIGTQRPARFLYPTDEINLNASFPGVKSVEKRVWWDIN